MQEAANPSELPQRFPVGVVQFPRIPGYRFQQLLGQGGMASVYLATQESLDRPVSIKVMDRDALQDETSKQRFENEARTIAKLTHPSIVGIHEVGRTSDEQMYYIMPYLPNGDLAQRDLTQNEPRIFEVLHALLSGLEYAHARGIVHRDVKEENVLFDSADRPLLTDFGIALSKSDFSRITTAGLTVGSSGYMAPEQARGAEVDGRADLYSVGVLTYALLIGDLPFHSPDALALALMHAQDAVPRLPAGKRHWQGFIDRAMAKSPAQRFDNAQQMLQALGRIDRRSGKELSSRVLRIFDRPAASWGSRKRLRLLAFVGMLLAATGLYAARQQFAEQGASGALAPPQPIHDAGPATTALPPIAPQVPLSAAAAAAETTPATDPIRDQHPAQRSHARYPATRHRPAKRRNWISRWWHRH